MANETTAEVDTECEIKIEAVWHVSDTADSFSPPTWQDDGNLSTTYGTDDSQNASSSSNSAFISEYQDLAALCPPVSAMDCSTPGTNPITDAHCVRVPTISSVGRPEKSTPSVLVSGSRAHDDLSDTILDLSTPQRRCEDNISKGLLKERPYTARYDFPLSRSQTERLISNGVSVIKTQNRMPVLSVPEVSNRGYMSNTLPSSAVANQTRASDYVPNPFIHGTKERPSIGNHNLSNGVQNYSNEIPNFSNRIQDFYSGIMKTGGYASGGVSNFSTTGRRIQDRASNGLHRLYAPGIASQTRMPNDLPNYSSLSRGFRNNVPVLSRHGFRSGGYMSNSVPQYSPSVYGFSHQMPSGVPFLNNFGRRSHNLPSNYASSLHNYGVGSRGRVPNFPTPVSVPVLKSQNQGNALNLSTSTCEPEYKNPNSSLQFPFAASVPESLSTNSVPITFPLWNFKTERFDGEIYPYSMENEKLGVHNEDSGMSATEPDLYHHFESDESMPVSYDGYTPAFLGGDNPDIFEYKPGIVPGNNTFNQENREVETNKAQPKRKRISKLPLKDKPYICRECNVGYIRKSQFQEHIKKHTGKHLDCNLCNITFRTSLELRSHLKGHYEEHEFKCKKCKISFSTKLALTGHSRMHAADKCFKCNTCERWFTTRASLRDHLGTHSESKFFKCTKCDKQYATRAGLKYHMITHDVVKPFACDQCHKRFITKRAHADHVVGHYKKKYFKCDDCEKRFLTKSKLRHHEKTHATERSFHCNKCDKGFTTKQGLAYHMRNHVWEKKVVCVVCDTKVRESNAYQCNLKSENQGESFNCTFCKDCFRCNMDVAEKEQTD